MRNWFIAVLSLLFAIAPSISIGAQEITDIRVDVFEASSFADISSTASGGAWSAASTWAGGVVPGAGDNVTIAGGATVTIDTAAAVAGNVTVAGGGSLKFGESGAFQLGVGQNVTIAPNGTFSTGTGSANQHVLTVGGNLTNNGTLDFSTNNNTAAAGIVFTGASSNTFGGTGAVTDVYTITINKGTSAANILELNVPSFTVQGTTTDGPVSGYLFLHRGTFKISGTFTGAHRTFPSPAYQIVAGAGFWLNNPNYSVTPQASPAHNLGNFRLSAGSYSVGTGTGHSFIVLPDSFTTIEGGTMTLAGGYQGQGRFNYNQSGGTLTTCTWGPAPGGVEGCFKTSFDTQMPQSFVMTGGEVVIQNPPVSGLAYDNARAPNNSTLTGGTIRFGNSQTAGTGTFRFTGSMPNLSIDTTAGSHTALFTSNFFGPHLYIRNVNIGPGATLNTGFSELRVFMTGDTFVNDGTWNTDVDTTAFTFCNDNVANFLYTGTGTHIGILRRVRTTCQSFTFGPAVGNVRILNLEIMSGNVINSNKLTIGNNSYLGRFAINFFPGAGVLDLPPVFELNHGTQELGYFGVARAIGPELNPQRTLSGLTVQDWSSTITVEGGDLTVGRLTLQSGVIDTGNNRLIHTGQYDGGFGYVNGTVVRRFTQTGSYLFPVNLGTMYCPIVNLTSITTIPTEISAKAVLLPMPGLDPFRSLNRYWVFEKNGEAAGIVRFLWHDDFVNGNDANYKIWRSTSGAPAVVPHGALDPVGNSIITSGSESVITGIWGLGEREALTSVNISGSVLTSGGAGIRNAVVTISGGNLPAPVTVVTGSLGTYLFEGLQPGQTYTITASAKRFRFAQPTQVVTPPDNVTNLNFTANPTE